MSASSSAAADAATNAAPSRIMRVEEGSTMRLDSAAAFMALLIVLASAPVLAQEEEQSAPEPGTDAAPESEPCAAQVGKKTGAVASQCTGWEQSSLCAVYNPIR